MADEKTRARDIPEITISFRPANARGMLLATLPNGTEFAVALNSLSGKLLANLQLYHDGARALIEPSEAKPATHFWETKRDEWLAKNEPTRPAKATKRAPANLPSLEELGLTDLDLDDLI